MTADPDDGPGPGAGALAELSAGLAGPGGDELVPLLRRAAGAAGPRAVEEAILQSHLFLGFPAALEGLRVWRRLREGEEVESDVDPSADVAAWEERGERVCRSVYGSAYEGLRRNVRRLHPDLDAWMIRDGYGKVLGRDGLDLASRELCIVATLAAAGSPPEPLHSHLRGALRAGAGPGQVETALEAGLERRDGGRREPTRELWRRVRRRTDVQPDA